MDARSSSGTRTRPEPDRLPVEQLLALASVGFVAIMTETVPAGLLQPIARGLSVSGALSGQLVTAYAAGSVIAAIPLVGTTLGWRRRRVLLAAVCGFLVFNTVTALSNSYAVTLAARFGAGVAAGLGWGLVASYARLLVPAAAQGRALALAMTGTPVALSIGTPAGTLLGTLIGWRETFGVMSGATLLLAAWIRWRLPDFPGRRPASDAGFRALLRIRPLHVVLLVVFLWMAAHNVLYTYAAAIAARAGLGKRVDLVLLLFGVAALGAMAVAGPLAERRLRPAVIGCLALFAVSAVLLAVSGRSPAVVLGTAALWGLSFGPASTLLNTAAADRAGPGADLALATVTTVWNGAIAAGGVGGGALLAAAGPAILAPAVLLPLSLALGIVLLPLGRTAFAGSARR